MDNIRDFSANSLELAKDSSAPDGALLGSVTVWLSQWRQGDQDAATKLASRYLQRLNEAAAKRIGAQGVGCDDAEDLALSSLNAVFDALVNNHYQELKNRDQLWAMLRTILRNRIANRLRSAGTLRNGGAFMKRPIDPDELAIKQAPDLIVQAQEEFRRLISSLPDQQLQQVCTLKLDGQTNQEIADRLEVSVPSVERYLRRIRDLWRDEIDTEAM